jgi:hypothetical protein
VWSKSDSVSRELASYLCDPARKIVNALQAADEIVDSGKVMAPRQAMLPPPITISRIVSGAGLCFSNLP